MFKILFAIIILSLLNCEQKDSFDLGVSAQVNFKELSQNFITPGVKYRPET